MSHHYIHASSHFSKRPAFKNECSACGKTLRRNANNKVGYICRSCGPPARGLENDNTACTICPFEMECTMRVQLGIWIRCETPDIADLERLQFMGGLDNERVRTELETALVERGNRKSLEEAISESAPKIYKNVAEGMPWQISIGFGEFGEL